MKKKILIIIIIFIVFLVGGYILFPKLKYNPEKYNPEKYNIEIEEDKTVELLMDKFYGKEYCDNLRNIIANKGETKVEETAQNAILVGERYILPEEETYFTKMVELYERKDVTINEKQKIRQELKYFFNDYKEIMSQELHLKIDTILKQKYIEE